MIFIVSFPILVDMIDFCIRSLLLFTIFYSYEYRCSGLYIENIVISFIFCAISVEVDDIDIIEGL